jgi:hypothetical protein
MKEKMGKLRLALTVLGCAAFAGLVIACNAGADHGGGIEGPGQKPILGTACDEKGVIAGDLICTDEGTTHNHLRWEPMK